MVQNPYPFFGFVYGGIGVTVTATNSRTGETLTEVTVSDSSYLIDATYFTSGYIDGDIITISVSGYVSRSAAVDLTSYESGRLVSLTTLTPTASTTFSVFDWPYPVTKVAVTPGFTMQASGEWSPETTIETAISAHVSDISLKELSFMDPAIVAIGARNLSCNSSVGLLPGDRVKITELDATISEWIVHTKKLSTGLLAKHAGICREIFVLKRRAAG